MLTKTSTNKLISVVENLSKFTESSKFLSGLFRHIWIFLIPATPAFDFSLQHLMSLFSMGHIDFTPVLIAIFVFFHVRQRTNKLNKKIDSLDSSLRGSVLLSKIIRGSMPTIHKIILPPFLHNIRIAVKTTHGVDIDIKDIYNSHLYIKANDHELTMVYYVNDFCWKYLFYKKEQDTSPAFVFTVSLPTVCDEYNIPCKAILNQRGLSVLS